MGHRSEFPNFDIFLSLKIVFTSAKSVDPDEMPISVAFHLAFHFLSKYPFMGIPAYKYADR